MEVTIHPKEIKGTITIPPSKSDAQRTYLSAALANGTSTIMGWGESDDEKAMRNVIQQLGAKCEVLASGELLITGLTEFPKDATISPGESGLGIRLLTPVCASFNASTRIEAEGSLKTRPMDFFELYLPKFQGKCVTTNGCPPLHVSGPLVGAEATVDGSLSSQFISGLLMALAKTEGDSRLEVLDMKSGAYIDMTLETLKAFGIEIQRPTPNVFEIKGGQKYTSTEYTIDADWSSASYWLVAAAIGHPVILRGLRLNSLQADMEMLKFLASANCQFIAKDDTIEVNGTYLTAFRVDATNCPDLFPALVTLAAYCVGKSTIKGVNRLVHKESHRGLTLQEEFGKLGVKIDLEDDLMTIHGTGVVGGGVTHSHHDHRIAMCLGIAGTRSEEPITIGTAEAVSKSYPTFWSDLEKLSIN